MRAPQLLWWRRALVQVHLWIGLLLGIYMVVLSVSGSLSVIRPDINRWSVPRSVHVEGTRLTGDALKDAVRSAYAPNEVAQVFERRRPDSPVMVTVLAGGKEVDRLFDPYALRDLGHMYQPIVEAIEWVVDLHDNLLAGQKGRAASGVGALLFLVLVITGAIVWWPGTGRVAHNLSPGKPAKSARFARRLHNALGVWTLALMFIWALTAVYLCYPDPFEWTIDYFDADLNDDRRPADWLVRLVVNLHFGRNWGMTVKYLWMALGLVPAVLFVTGFVTWWVRVVKRRAAGLATESRAAEPALAALAEDGAQS